MLAIAGFKSHRLVHLFLIAQVRDEGHEAWYIGGHVLEGGECGEPRR